ncbi:glycosyltransferase family 2 protein [Rothia aerolata]|uniref:Glycosyl transferase n=1 Tax=Rothia aerolata TaxID=1812262 RepID=A0A917ISK3_9MICC|nr:glycosyltransferase family A protein [Rothia aerolata]GGH62995.1 glycosyl transferase [Rothia aerolata]
MKAESNSPYQAAVIIPTRGGAAKLHYPLDALEQQTEKDFQVIVVCDGDIDGSEEVVDSYRKRGILNIEAIVFPENRGRVAALNAGHRAAHAHVLIRCDDDLEPAADFVEQHVRLHRGPEEVGVVGLVRNIFPENAYSRAYGYFRDSKFREEAYASREEKRWHFWNANVSLTRSMYEKIGGYDERYRLYGWEDVDMGYMLYRAGVSIILAPELETDHHIAATTSASRATRALYSGAARATFVEKHGSHVLAETKPNGIWGFLVRSNSRVTNEKTIHLAGKLIDSVADRLPKNIAEKLIALLVESAGYAGIKYPHRAQKVF